MNILSIFKAGQFIAKNGQAYNFSEAQLKATAMAYDASAHEAPLVLGHPSTDSPAYGWVGSLAFQGGFIKAVCKSVTTQFSEWVNKGHYKKISASFYPPDSPNNPVPGVYYLRHVGFLGANAPAVRGLPQPSFGASDHNIIHVEFSHRLKDSISFSAPAGYVVESEQLEKYERILNYQESHDCDYQTAVFNFENDQEFLQ